ncbi:MAG: hypothetical protein WAM94_13935, partial [Chromatiaceae bacterium]
RPTRSTSSLRGCPLAALERTAALCHVAQQRVETSLALARRDVSKRQGDLTVADSDGVSDCSGADEFRLLQDALGD